MRKILEKFWKEAIEKSDGKRENLITAILTLLSFWYYLGVRLRSFLYRVGILKERRLADGKVISLGNITVGGTGKTPTCLLVANILKKAGRKVVILSRGYRGKAKERVNVVSDGQEILLREEEAGDEPYLMAKKLRTVPVLTSKRRYWGGKYACDRFGAEVIILDDGFQHRGLKRDLDICLVNEKAGFGNGHLFPRGILREPIEALKRADLFFVTGQNSSPGEDGIIAKIKEIKKDPVIFRADYQANGLRDLEGKQEFEVGYLGGKKVFAFSGIATPSSFLDLLGKLGAVVAGEYSFPDHHRYGRDDLVKIKKMAGKVDMIVTTEKDGVKIEEGLLPPDFTVFTLAVKMKIEEEDRFADLIMSIQ